MNPAHLIMNAERTHLDWFPGWLIRNRQTFLLTHKKTHTVKPLTTGQMLTGMDPLPSGSVLLGRCQDGLPLLMALTDPEIGAILISGDAGSGKTHHIQVMVDSAIRTHRPEDLQVMVLTHQPDEWDLLFESERSRGYFKSCHAWYDHRAEEVLQSLFDLAKRRLDVHDSGGLILLVLDDFNFVESLDYQAQFQLHWLLTYGVQSNIWPIAAINAGQASRYRFWIETFRTRIIGRIRSDAYLNHTLFKDEIGMKTLEPATFRVRSGRDWTTYQIPLLGD